MTDIKDPVATRFHVELIKPSHYDDDGYLIQWLKAWIPSNSLASLFALTRQAAQEKLLGDDVDILVNAYDETNTRVPVKRIIRRIRDAHGNGIVCMVGVQSNQYPRAMDLARRFRAEGIQVAIGGFHVSGCIAMLPEIPDDLKAAEDLGITLFAGESEGRFDDFLRATYERRLEPLYNYMNDLP
ncbi:MAG: radical SAM protein, partial [Chromatiaceae bacterium]|nr:radical SAM protein [Chromatiaceae bacterium]